MFIGGQKIKEFDAFLHLFLAAAGAMHSDVQIPHDDQFALNRVLAGFGGPPARQTVTLELEKADSLPALILYLLLQRDHCPISIGDAAGLGPLKQYVHILAHALMPMAAGVKPVPAEDVTSVLTDELIALRPLITYNEDGEIAGVLETGSTNQLAVAAILPVKLAINPKGPVIPDTEGPLHAVTLYATVQPHPRPRLET